MRTWRFPSEIYWPLHGTYTTNDTISYRPVFFRECNLALSKYLVCLLKNLNFQTEYLFLYRFFSIWKKRENCRCLSHVAWLWNSSQEIPRLIWEYFQVFLFSSVFLFRDPWLLVTLCRDAFSLTIEWNSHSPNSVYDYTHFIFCCSDGITFVSSRLFF